MVFPLLYLSFYQICIFYLIEQRPRKSIQCRIILIHLKHFCLIIPPVVVDVIHRYLIVTCVTDLLVDSWLQSVNMIRKSFFLWYVT